jgi:hypothetical protein
MNALENVDARDVRRAQFVSNLCIDLSTQSPCTTRRRSAPPYGIALSASDARGSAERNRVPLPVPPPAAKGARTDGADAGPGRYKVYGVSLDTRVLFSELQFASC